MPRVPSLEGSDTVCDVVPIAMRQAARTRHQNRQGEDPATEAVTDGDPLTLRTPIGQGRRLGAEEAGGGRNGKGAGAQQPFQLGM
jgi:hypothetical protein